MIYASRFLYLQEPNMQGPDVMEVQLILKNLGLYRGNIDNVFGESTESAVIEFQKSVNLKADGIVGSETWSQLLLRNYPRPMLPVMAAQTLPSIYIDTTKKRLTFRSDNFTKTYKIAIGKPTTPSPLGNWVIVQKALNPGGPFGVRWMRLSVPWGGYGIHGTNNPRSIGRAVSHGCIRLYNEDVIELYERTPIGTPVTMVGAAYANRNMKKGDSGSDVKQVQRMLRKLRYYRNKIDGYFGDLTETAVMRFQADNNLLVDGIVGPQTIYELQKAYAVAQKEQQP